MMITTQKIKELRNLFTEHHRWEEIVSDQAKTAQDRNGKNTIKIQRDGKEIDVREKELWKELYFGGYESQAWKILSAKYPEILNAHQKEEGLAIELRDFTIKNFGFAFNQMSLINLIDLIRAFRRYELMRFFFIDKLISLFYGIFGADKE